MIVPHKVILVDEYNTGWLVSGFKFEIHTESH